MGKATIFCAIAAGTFGFCIYSAVQTRKEVIRTQSYNSNMEIVDVVKDFRALILECSVGLITCMMFVIRVGTDFVTSDDTIYRDVVIVSFIVQFAAHMVYKF